MRNFIMSGLVLVAVAACDRPARETGEPEPTPSEQGEAALAGFQHGQTVDLSGYYLPLTPVQAGNWRLHHIAMSDARGFEVWQGGERSQTYGPVMLHFDDVSSPTGTNELGGEYHEVTARVLPDAYEITDERVRFRGQAPGVGTVTFEGRLDAGELELAQRNLGGTEGVVLTGTLSAGGRVFEGQQFRWWMGD